MQKKDIESFRPTSRQDWRQWLRKNHKSKESIWLVLFRKESYKPTISWSEAVEEALCYGWVDSKRKPFDNEKFLQFFSRRQPKGTWSKVNKAKVRQLIDKRLMTKAGFESIKTAKQNGSWTILDEVEELKIPKDLAEKFKAQPGSADYFLSLSKSVRKSILQWLVLAKRPETRQNRINEIAQLAAQGLKPKQFR